MIKHRSNAENQLISKKYKVYSILILKYITKLMLKLQYNPYNLRFDKL